MVDPHKQPGIRIGQVYLSGVKFGYKTNPLILPVLAPQPDAQVTINVRFLTTKTEDAVLLVCRAQTTEHSPHIYFIDVEMSAIIETDPGNANMRPMEFVAKSGMTFLFPFLRETVANLTMRGRFGPIWLKPVNIQLLTQNLGGEDATPRRKTAKKLRRKTTKRPSAKGR